MSEMIRFLESEAEFIQMMGRKCSVAGFVLKHGRAFEPRKLPKNLRLHKGRIKGCFRNAAIAALRDPSLTYVEGYAASIIPVLHAWCVDPDGGLLEVTWGKPGDEYYGIPFQTRFLRRSLLEAGYYGLIDQWKNNWPLLRGKYPKREWLKPMKGKA